MWWPAFLLALPLAHAASIPAAHDHNDESHHVNKRLPKSWSLDADHPAQAMYKRAPGDGTDYPAVGSPTWSAAWPQSSPDVNQLPKQWVDALNDAVAAGKIPNIPQSHNTPGTNPIYPPGVNPNGPEVCSATYKCRIEGDVWDAPDGTFATAFDDGPTPVCTMCSLCLLIAIVLISARLQYTPTLLKFLEDNEETATHFMIGVNILQNPQLFLDTFNSGGDIAVHTWTHPYMTTLSNLEIVAQLGWTAEIIRNSTGGRVPRYWRPPFGDSDVRVRSIALEVFGLETVIWNMETSDWGLATGLTTPEKIHDSFVHWLAGPKSPGMMVLEHETSAQSVAAFMAAYPLIKPAGWKVDSLAALIGDSTYQNSKDGSSPVKFDGILANGADNTPPASLTSASSAPASQANSVPAASQTSQTGTRSQTPSPTTEGQHASQTSNSASSRGAHLLVALCTSALVAAISTVS
ncbi:hypothetical protein DXG03_009297 [Asterophora parasitica]|uniref:chitin deacetylase n=1 Tax=Asterophora parasitica TaxID=117018 RepID=A0A9P7K9X5_9AGAR|nr:hypothetical protein DXG03_009297 [Asterophora parasitica]